MLAFYLHNLSPDIFRFSDNVALHWYGFAYVLGFYCCFLVMRGLARRGYGELKPDQVGDFITLVALFGVVLGGRVGYILLYNLDEYLKNPLDILKLWRGGMASHGGVLGVLLFTLWYGRKHKLSGLGLGDNLVVGVPLGLLFGRIANFINGELWGHPSAVPWAVKFPTEIHHHDFVPRAPMAFNYDALPSHSNEIIAAVKELPDGLQQLEAALPARHPSQLYEAGLEGLLLFLVMLFIRTRSKNLPNGLLSGSFFILYAIVRIIGENYRVPDATLIMGVTRGQFYSVFMILIGLSFIVFAMVSKKRQASAVN
ncbi:MAG: prolipoprotein diacylglyceryl transferase [Verrucomicrobia bacterium]|nr:prolipoprotein diacylglyceryl transferase [Verrucomicrobiota bacterium]